jgi:Ca2+:H+ antiporter
VAHWVHAPVESHEKTFSVIVSVVLLIMFALSLPFSLRKEAGAGRGDEAHKEQPRWPVALAVGLLAIAGAASAFVSDWFVVALEPAMEALNISQAFAGLVIVAIAGNAIENVVGVQLAARGQSEYAFSVVLNSPLQISLVLAPVLVLVSVLFGFGALTLVFAPMLIISLMLAVILTALIAFDGESTWLEGATLIALYCVIAASFWWG